MADPQFTLTVNKKVVQTTMATAIPSASRFYLLWLTLAGNNGKTVAEFFDFLRGPAMTWNDLTLEQKQALTGAAFTWNDLTEEQKLELKGEPFRWQDFTPEMLAELEGPPGPPGDPEISLFGIGAKVTGVDAGELGEESYFDGYMYKCVAEGEAGVAVWIKWAILDTI